MSKKISWHTLGAIEKTLLASICPECLCQMRDYEQLIGWQKCGACGYTRQNPIDSENGNEEFDLIPKTF